MARVTSGKAIAAPRAMNSTTTSNCMSVKPLRAITLASFIVNLSATIANELLYHKKTRKSRLGGFNTSLYLRIAFTLRTPLDEDSSLIILKWPISPVLETCGPPQSSREKACPESAEGLPAE